MAFTAPCNWPHFVEISYTEFHSKAANIQRQDVYRAMYAFNSACSSVDRTLARLLENASCTEFHDNLTTSFAADTASLQTDVDSE